MFDALIKGKGNPDRMKGALYVLGNKGTSEFLDTSFSYHVLNYPTGKLHT